MTCSCHIWLVELERPATRSDGVMYMIHSGTVVTTKNWQDENNEQKKPAREVVHIEANVSATVKIGVPCPNPSEPRNLKETIILEF